MCRANPLVLQDRTWRPITRTDKMISTFQAHPLPNLAQFRLPRRFGASQPMLRRMGLGATGPCFGRRGDGVWATSAKRHLQAFGPAG